MKTELAWLAAPIIMILSQLGGTCWRPARRILIPLLMVCVAAYFKQPSLWLVPMAALIFGAASLPFTLIGSGIKEHWFNWVWIWIWAVLITASAIPICLAYGGWDTYLYAMIMPVVITGTSCTLSNIKATSKFFQWKWTEGIAWMFAMYPALVIITT